MLEGRASPRGRSELHLGPSGVRASPRGRSELHLGPSVVRASLRGGSDHRLGPSVLRAMLSGRTDQASRALGRTITGRSLAIVMLGLFGALMRPPAAEKLTRSIARNIRGGLVCPGSRAA